ncbi:MAG: F0F1 ATP synthase subunit epsilon [Halanaerobiaceae bacterium]
MAEKKKKIHLEVVTPERVTYSDDIIFLEAPAEDGLIGILPNHAPLVTALDIGTLLVRKNVEDEFLLPISEGFMEVKPDRINVVVRTAELPSEIDVERAEKAKERAQERLEADSDKINYARAEANLEKALARLRAAEHHERNLI